MNDKPPTFLMGRQLNQLIKYIMQMLKYKVGNKYNNIVTFYNNIDCTYYYG